MNQHQIMIRFPSNPRFMQVVRGVISHMTGLAGFSEKETRLVTLAVDEACTNIMRHTYKNEPCQPIEAWCTIDKEYLLFQLLDYGEAIDPSRIRHRELDEVRPGGLGTFFMKNIMDTVEYRQRPEGGNEIRMIKKLPSQKSDSGADPPGPG